LAPKAIRSTIGPGLRTWNSNWHEGDIKSSTCLTASEEDRPRPAERCSFASCCLLCMLSVAGGACCAAVCWTGHCASGSLSSSHSDRARGSCTAGAAATAGRAVLDAKDIGRDVSVLLALGGQRNCLVSHPARNASRVSVRAGHVRHVLVECAAESVMCCEHTFARPRAAYRGRHTTAARDFQETLNAKHRRTNVVVRWPSHRSTRGGSSALT
jgi:hypothetical protein